MGIEPTLLAWEAKVLPLNYTRLLSTSCSTLYLIISEFTIRLPPMNEKYYRKIRSFVRREGRMTRPQERAMDRLWPKYGVNYDEKWIDFKALFGRTSEVTLEVGFGN